MSRPFHITVCASGGGGNFQALIDEQDRVGFTINLLLADRQCGAVDRARRHRIPCLTLDHGALGPAFFDRMDEAIPAATELVVLAGFMPIVSARLCRKWAGRMINTHPALLPKYGGKGMYGVKVQEAVLQNREPFAGCTVHYVSEAIDAGEIILQAQIPVRPGESAWELGGRVFLEETKLLPQAIGLIMNDAGYSMFAWKKMGLLLEPSRIPNRPEWFDEYAQAPNAIVFDEFVRVYFCCRPKPDADKQFVSYCSYVDLKRRNLREIINVAAEPILPLGGLGSFDEFGTYPVSAIKAGDAILAYYGGWTRCESVPFNVSLGLAQSLDGGKTFQKYGRGPVLGHSPDEPFVVTSPKIRKYGDIWYLAYTAGQKWFVSEGRPEIVYKLRLAQSADGIKWARLKRNLIPDKLGSDEAQACPDIIYQNGVYHMFFCYREATNFRFAKERTYRIGYARSSDMLNWTRDDAKAGIDVSAEGWDSEMVAYPHVFELDGAIYMLYLGNQVGRYGFGLAKLEGELA